MTPRNRILGTRQASWRWLLALVLLIGQASAQVHAYAHLGRDSGPVDPIGLHTQVCSQCLSSAPLLSAVGSSSTLVLQVCGGDVRIDPPAVAPLPAQRAHHGFRSRAPPVLL